MMNFIIVKKAFKQTIPVLMGYLVLGCAFGMLLVDSGYPIYYALIMSVFIYAGSMQFLTISLLMAHYSLFNTFIMTLMVNARHLVYGISMLKKFEKVKYLKPYMIFSLSDETYSLLVNNNSKNKYELFLICLFDHIFWIIGSLIGACISNFITFNSSGLDFSMTALFIVIVINQIKSNKNHEATIVGFLVSIIALIIFGRDNFVIMSLVTIILILVIEKKRLDNKYE